MVGWDAELTIRDNKITSLEAYLARKETTLQERDEQLHIRGGELKDKGADLARLRAEVEGLKKANTELNDLSNCMYIEAQAKAIRNARAYSEAAVVKEVLVLKLSAFLACNKPKANDILPIADLGPDGIDLMQFVEGVDLY